MKRIKDEFEVPVIIAREKGLPPAEVSRIAKAVNEARKAHYAKLKEIRSRYEKKVLSDMSPELRRQFQKLNGKFYDYESERVLELTKDK